MTEMKAKTSQEGSILVAVGGEGWIKWAVGQIAFDYKGDNHNITSNLTNKMDYLYIL